jgi:hypothetical protein
MRPIKTVVDLDMPIEEVVKIMHLKRWISYRSLAPKGTSKGKYHVLTSLIMEYPFFQTVKFCVLCKADRPVR